MFWWFVIEVHAIDSLRFTTDTISHGSFRFLDLVCYPKYFFSLWAYRSVPHKLSQFRDPYRYITWCTIGRSIINSTYPPSIRCPAHGHVRSHCLGDPDPPACPSPKSDRFHVIYSRLSFVPLVDTRFYLNFLFTSFVRERVCYYDQPFLTRKSLLLTGSSVISYCISPIWKSPISRSLEATRGPFCWNSYMSNENYPIRGHRFVLASSFLNKKDLKTWGTDKEVVGNSLPGVHSPVESNLPSLGL